MNSNSQDLNDARSARRRLIKGGFSVPAVLTVASGSAVARTSSGCMSREAAQGNTPNFVTDTSTANGTFVRVAALTFLPNGSGKTRSWWITYASLQAVASAAGVNIAAGWITSGQALCVETGTASGPGNYTSGQIYSAATNPALPAIVAPTSPEVPRYYAVLFNTSGDVIGVSLRFTATGQTGGAVNTSCWTSFKPV